ncbi:MAG TPA: glycosyltransferase [Acidimicrobiales bacterium]|nr:glycosyltransferase [Acidimicrobiales bacterium]
MLCVKNGAETIAEQLHALCDQTYQGIWEVVLVDNGSTDDSVAIARSASTSSLQLRVVRATEKASLSYARNVGVDAAKGNLIAFCDADDRAEPDWLEEIVAVALTADMVGGFVDITKINDPVVRRWRPEYPRDAFPFSGPPAAHGANMAIWKDVFTEVGGCDEHLLGAAGDDIDLSWRVRRAGKKVAFAPRAVMNYRLRPTLKGQARQMFVYGRAAVILRRRHGARPKSTVKLILSQLRLLACVPRYAWSQVGRGQWVRTTAMCAGELAEQLRRPTSATD